MQIPLKALITISFLVLFIGYANYKKKSYFEYNRCNETNTITVMSFKTIHKQIDYCAQSYLKLQEISYAKIVSSVSYLKALMEDLTKSCLNYNKNFFYQNKSKLTQLEGIIDKKLTGHSDIVKSLAVLEDQAVVSGSFREIIIWNISIGVEVLRIINPHTGWVTSLAAVENNRFASAGDDGKIIIWNSKTGRTLKTFNHKNHVHCIALINGNTLASASNEGTIKIWNIENGLLVRTLTGHIKAITSLAALGKNRLASGSTDNTIIIWNIHNGRIIRTINDIVEAESPKLSHVHLLRLPGEKLVHGSDYDVIKFWNIAQFGKHVSKHDGFSNGISSMTMLNDGSTLAIAPLDSNEAIRLVNINTGRIKSIWGNVNQHELAVLENGRLISAASDDSIIIWK